MSVSRSLLILALVAAALAAPALFVAPGAADSAMYNEVWTRQFAALLAQGELWPRWMPASFEGLGSPTFYFYPPLAFHVAGLLALALPTAVAIAAAAGLFLFASGAAMFAWLRGKTRHALPLAALYMAAPYHLMDLYLRGAFAEAAAFAWLPLLALSVERLRARWGPALLALAYAGLILTHLPLAVLAGVFLVAPLTLHKVWREPDLLAPAAVGLVAALLLAAPYLAPALLLRGEVHSELLHSVAFAPARWAPWRLRPIDRTPATVFALIALAWSALALGARRTDAVWRWTTLAAAGGSLALLPAIWALPVLSEVQFPWRLLAVVEFAGLTAFALRPPPRLIAVLGAVLLLAAETPVLRAAAELSDQAPARLTSRMTDAVEYLPAALAAPGLATGAKVDLSSLAGPLVVGPAQARFRPHGRIDLEVVAPGRVTIRRAHFSAWRVIGPSGAVPLAAGPLIAFDALPGRYALVRVATWPERLGWAAAALGLLLLAASLTLPLRMLASARLRASLPHPFERPF